VDQSNADFLAVYRKDGLSASKDSLKTQTPSKDLLINVASEAATSIDVELFDLVFGNAECHSSMGYFAVTAMSHSPDSAIQMLDILKNQGWDVKNEGYFILL
jgi:hypothetical protein